jgi:hypothetical protein
LQNSSFAINFFGLWVKIDCWVVPKLVCTLWDLPLSLSFLIFALPPSFWSLEKEWACSWARPTRNAVSVTFPLAFDRKYFLHAFHCLLRPSPTTQTTPNFTLWSPLSPQPLRSRSCLLLSSHLATNFSQFWSHGLPSTGKQPLQTYSPARFCCKYSSEPICVLTSFILFMILPRSDLQLSCKSWKKSNNNSPHKELPANRIPTSNCQFLESFEGPKKMGSPAYFLISLLLRNSRNWTALSQVAQLTVKSHQCSSLQVLANDLHFMGEADNIFYVLRHFQSTINVGFSLDFPQ